MIGGRISFGYTPSFKFFLETVMKKFALLITLPLFLFFPSKADRHRETCALAEAGQISFKEAGKRLGLKVRGDGWVEDCR